MAIVSIAPGIYRINTPAPLPDGSSFNFNQYLIADEAPLLFHTGPRGRSPMGRSCRSASIRVAGSTPPMCRTIHLPQGGSGATPITESDILGPSEAFRAPMDYYAHAPHAASVLERIARLEPQVLACVHGSAWRGMGRI